MRWGRGKFSIIGHFIYLTFVFKLSRLFLQKMNVRIEKNDSAHQSRHSKIHLKPKKNRSHDLFKYPSWRTSRNKNSFLKTLSQSDQKRHFGSLKTLLGDLSHLRICSDSHEIKKLKEQNRDNPHKDLLIKSIDCSDSFAQPFCELIIKSINGHVKKYHYKPSTTDKLKQFLQEKYQPCIWKTFPDNASIDYYLSLKNKDISFLNGQTLNLWASKMERHSKISLNSFQIEYCIGSGGFSKVYLCRFKEDGKFYAMKVIDKNFIVKNKKKKIVMNEKKIMQKLQHPFLIEIKFAFESNKSLIFILQFCPGGELFGLVKKFRIMNQSVARFYIVEILLGLQQIHRNGIVYRDFKPENILIDLEGHIRIADFGLAKPGIPTCKEKAYSFCGSPQYMPPEMILKKGHSLPVDFYCLGALLYQLITGLPPFYNQDPNEIYEGTINKNITFPSHTKLSVQLKQLLKALLCKDETKRLGTNNGVEQILAHPWFRKVSIQTYENKEVQPPVRFTGIKDLNLIFSEMKTNNQESSISDILNEQQVEKKVQFERVMEKFVFDYRQSKDVRQPCRTKKQNSFSTLSLKNHGRSLKTAAKAKQRQKNLKCVMSQRSFTGNRSIRKKPLTTRVLDLNFFLK